LTTLKAVRKRAEADAKTHGYFLNPDEEMLQGVLKGLKRNEERYGYPSCPCRLATGSLERDRDIICPCDYRDPDVEEFGNCYCALYVNKEVAEGKSEVQRIPERRPTSRLEQAHGRPPAASTGQAVKQDVVSSTSETNLKLWFCKVCGYLCFREEPPHKCPICKAKREMFSELVLGMNWRTR
jgi:ferredoxin-thioredoxin reductase catalytic subunit/rubredoxin